MLKGMERKSTILPVIAVIGLVLLLVPIKRSTRPPKTRPQRISGVNSLRSVTFTLVSTNAPPGNPPGPGK